MYILREVARINMAKVLQMGSKFQINLHPLSMAPNGKSSLPGFFPPPRYCQQRLCHHLRLRVQPAGVGADGLRSGDGAVRVQAGHRGPQVRHLPRRTGALQQGLQRT